MLRLDCLWWFLEHIFCYHLYNMVINVSECEVTNLCAFLWLHLMQSVYSRYVPIKAMEPVEKFCLNLGMLA